MNNLTPKSLACIRSTCLDDRRLADDTSREIRTEETARYSVNKGHLCNQE